MRYQYFRQYKGEIEAEKIDIEEIEPILRDLFRTPKIGMKAINSATENKPLQTCFAYYWSKKVV